VSLQMKHAMAATMNTMARPLAVAGQAADKGVTEDMRALLDHVPAPVAIRSSPVSPQFGAVLSGWPAGAP